MNRRKAIKRMAILSGGALSLTTVAGIMGGCSSGPHGYELKTLDNSQNKLIIVISEHIIPTTDTPGAKAAGVNQYVDKMMTNWHTEEEKEHFLSGLAHVNEVSNNMSKRDFLDLEEKEQITVLEQLEKEANENPMQDSNLQPFFRMMKELTIVGYYTSEVGATKELQTSIVPGYYNGNVPYSDIGTAWSNAGR